MSKDRESLPENEEEQDALTTMVSLAPLFNLIIRALELILKILRII
jgi:hypothetical protein